MANPVQENTPITAAVLTSAVGGVLAAFTTLSAEQVAAILAVVSIVAAVIVQRYGTQPKES